MKVDVYSEVFGSQAVLVVPAGEDPSTLPLPEKAAKPHRAWRKKSGVDLVDSGLSMVEAGYAVLDIVANGFHVSTAE
jgi:hypothetical protein